MERKPIASSLSLNPESHMSSEHLSSEGWWPEDPFPKWLTHVANKLVLAIAGSLGPLHMGLSLHKDVITWWLASSNVSSPRDPGRSCDVFYNIT